MKLTENLKKWLAEHKSVPEDADDAAYRKAAADALVDESLTDEEFVAMTKDPDADKASTLQTLLESIAKSQQEMREFASTLAKQQAAVKVEEPKPKMAKPESGVTDKMIASGSETDDDMVVKHITADKRYSTNRSAMHYPEKNSRGMVHPFAGQRMFEGGSEGRRYIDDPSELDRAVIGAFGKWMLFSEPIAKGLIPRSVITDHDRELVQYAARNMNWAGVITRYGEPEESGTYVNNRRLTEMEVKTVFDESGASQGQEIVPMVWDDAIITYPLLHSEFFPRINLVNVARGRRMESAIVGDAAKLYPQMTWETYGDERDAIPLCTTTAFVQSFDTNIHTIVGAMTFGLDFLSDTPVAFGDIVTQLYGQRLLHELDDVIVGGDGTKQPTGINGLGTDVTFSNAWTIAKMVELMLTVGKQYKAGFDKNRICWGSNTTSYARVRGLATGVTGDTRLVFGDDVESYMVLGHPYLVNESYGNADMTFTNLARYRMYRRLGLTARMETGGQTLALANSALLVVRARFGGQLEDTGATAHCDDGQA